MSDKLDNELKWLRAGAGLYFGDRPKEFYLAIIKECKTKRFDETGKEIIGENKDAV